MQGNPVYWNEFQWEKFLRVQERRHETIMMNAIRTRNPWRLGMMWTGLLSEPLQDDYADFWNTGGDGDEWKIYSNPCYRIVCDSLETIRNSLDDIQTWQQSHVAVVELIGRSYSIPNLIASGLMLLFEYRCTGGALAFCKRALYLANDSLGYLKELASEKVITSVSYRELIGECTIVRNAIGCYISDIRLGDATTSFA
jgi:hypothetical protein